MALHEYIQSINESELQWFRETSGVNIPTFESMIRDRNLFDIAIPTVELLPTSGIIYRQRTVDLGDGAHTNSYETVIDTNVHVVDIQTRARPFKMRRLLVNDKQMVAAINGGFFYFVDLKSVTPPHYSYNLCIQDNVIYGLPATDGGAVVIDNQNNVQTRDIKAQGEFRIGNNTYNWKGNNTDTPIHDSEVALYNAACCHVVSEVGDKNLFKQRRVNPGALYTPAQSDMQDIIIDPDDTGILRVTDVRESGTSTFFDGHVIVQIPKRNNVQRGEQVIVTKIDDIDMSTVLSALTVGPSLGHVVDPNHNHPVDRDKSLGDNPPFAHHRKARSLLYKRGDLVHFRIFDAIPGVKHMQGVTPAEAHDIVYQEYSDIEWAYYLDAGKSVNMIVRDETEQRKTRKEGLIIQGNNFYLQKVNQQGCEYILAGRNGRWIPSAVVARKKDPIY